MKLPDSQNNPYNDSPLTATDIYLYTHHHRYLPRFLAFDGIGLAMGDSADEAEDAILSRRYRVKNNSGRDSVHSLLQQFMRRVYLPGSVPVLKPVDSRTPTPYQQDVYTFLKRV